MKHPAWCLLLLCQCAFGQASKQNDLSSISGNPYLFKEWNDGVVRFSSGRTMNQFKLKFDCLKNQLMLLFDGNTFAAESKVSEFVLYPRKKDSLLFRRGYPASERITDQTYLHVMLQGKATLLRLITRNIVEEKELVSVSGRNNRRLEEVEYYYLFKDGVITLLPANRNDLPTQFGDKKDSIARFITEQQLKMHAPEDFVQVVKKYNELLQ